MSVPTQAPVEILHAHTTMSMLDGASPVKDYITYAVDRGLKLCSCTDHGWLSGIYDLISQSNKAGIMPVAGCEFYLKPHPQHQFSGKEYDYFHLTVWASNSVGYQNLVALATRSWTEGRPITRWGKPRPRITWQDLEELNQGLIVGSGCIEGPIGKCLLKNETEQAKINAAMLQGIFGDRLFFEVMPATVDRDYVKEQSIQVRGTNGILYCFMPDDLLETDRGLITAADAVKMRPEEIYNVRTVRMQDGPIDDSTAPSLTLVEAPISFEMEAPPPLPPEIYAQ